MTELEKNKQILTMLKQMCDKAGMVEGEDYYYNHEADALWIGQTPDEDDKTKGVYFTSLQDARGQIIYSSGAGDKITDYYEPFLNASIWDDMTEEQKYDYVKDEVFKKAFFAHAMLTTGHSFIGKALNYPVEVFTEDLSQVQTEPLDQYYYAVVQQSFYEHLITEVEKNTVKATRRMDGDNLFIYHVMKDYWEKKTAILEKEPEIKELITKERPFDVSQFFDNLTADKEKLREQEAIQDLNAELSPVHSIINRFFNPKPWREKYNELLSDKEITASEKQHELEIFIVKVNLQYKLEQGKELTTEERWKLQAIQKKEDLTRIVKETQEQRKEAQEIYKTIENLKINQVELKEKFGKVMDLAEKYHDMQFNKYTTEFKNAQKTKAQTENELQKITNIGKLRIENAKWEYTEKLDQLNKESEQNKRKLEGIKISNKAKQEEAKNRLQELMDSKKDKKQQIFERLDDIFTMKNAEIIARKYNDKQIQAAQMTGEPPKTKTAEEIYQGIKNKEIQIKGNPAFNWKDKVALVCESVKEEVKVRKEFNKEFKDAIKECKDYQKLLEISVQEEINQVMQKEKDIEKEKTKAAEEKKTTIDKLNKETREQLHKEGVAFKDKINNDILYDMVMTVDDARQYAKKMVGKDPKTKQLVDTISKISKQIKENKQNLKQAKKDLNQMEEENRNR